MSRIISLSEVHRNERYDEGSFSDFNYLSIIMGLAGEGCRRKAAVSDDLIFAFSF
jgi:hypothetical protein